MLAVLLPRQGIFQGPSYRGFILGEDLDSDSCLLMQMKATHNDCVGVYMIIVMQKGA